MCSGLATAMTVRVRVIWVLRMLSWDGPVQMARYALVRGVPLFCFFLRTPFLLLPDFLGWFLFPFFFFYGQKIYHGRMLAWFALSSRQIPLRGDGCFSLFLIFLWVGSISHLTR